MNKGNVVKLKFLSGLLVVYLTVLFAVIIPLHYHNDCDSHDDCAICAISCLPLISVGSSSVHALFVLLLTLVFASVIIKIFPGHNLHLRSPPVF
jgi:hypothetical protein